MQAGYGIFQARKTQTKDREREREFEEEEGGHKKIEEERRLEETWKGQGCGLASCLRFGICSIGFGD